MVDASAESLLAFVREPAEPGSIIHADSWMGHEPLERNGYRYEVTFVRGPTSLARPTFVM